LPQLVHVDKEKCVSCHACIAACPVKICNDGSGEYVSVAGDTCIGCGRCLAICSHGARYFTDDFSRLLGDLAGGTPIVAVVAPSAVANFPDQHLRLNGWLKSLGVTAVFDVSHGAELCARSYFEHINRRRPQLIISQPCPAVVSYIQIHQPALLEYLAPVDSPILHTLKMIRRYHPEFAGHRLAVISPCLAKRRELDETGVGDYSVTFSSIHAHLKSAGRSLDDFVETGFANPTPNKGMLLPTPGGLLRALEQWLPGVRGRAREIHGSEAVYKYLKSLPETIARHPSALPLIVDCLNCEHGCACGPGSTAAPQPDVLQHRVEERCRAAGQPMAVESLDTYWEDRLYARRYVDLSLSGALRLPDAGTRQAILRRMYKFTEHDLYNCCSCGYGSCDQMVVAIHNGLNRPENCHHYLARERQRSDRELAQYHNHLENLVEGRTTELRQANARLEQEIQQRRRMEEALVDSERKLRDVVEASPIPQFVIDRNHVVTYWNRAIEQFTGIPAREMVGTNGHWRPFYSEPRPCLADLLVDDDIVAIGTLYESRWRKTSLLAGAYEFTDFFPVLGEHGKWLCFTAAVIRDSRGVIVGAVETLEDITAQKEAERQLARSQEAAEAANRAKSEFLANMSHEIRTPMTAILGYADLVLDSLQRPEDIEAVNTIRRNGEHLLSVINDILDLSKVEAGMFRLRPTDCAVQAVVDEVVSLMRVRAEAKNLAFDTEYVYPLPRTILSDPTRLRQILINLVGNAIKFTEVGGVRVRVGLDRRSASAAQLQFEVADTGVGITEEQRQRLFQPFSQGDSSYNRKCGGTGLGLAISRRIAELLGGRIEVHSTPGKGSTFRLTLDIGAIDEQQLTTAPSVCAPSESEATPCSRSTWQVNARILLAEDGPDNQRLISFLLKKAGADVVLAENGQVAVREVLATLGAGASGQPGGPRPFDMILMDMQMPILDGYEATRQIRAAHYAGPIVALTAHAMVEDRAKCLEAGCSDYMSKPIDRDKLLSLVAYFCRQSAAMSPTAPPGGARG
jgi:signal transduction histidine kinase/AmiR/NasT family two-component response regulator/ferredoxin